MSKKQQNYASRQVISLTDWFVYTLSTHPQSAAQGRAPGWRPCDAACELCCGLGWMKAGGVPHCFWQWKAGVVHRKSSSSCAWAQQRGNAAVVLCARVRMLGREDGSAVVFYVLNCNCSSCFHSYYCICLSYEQTGKYDIAQTLTDSFLFMLN